MKTYSDNKPNIFESIGNGGFRYNYNIKEIEVDKFDIIDNKNEINIKQIQWEYDNVIIYLPIDKDKITKAVIANTWDIDYENKLINDYNEINLGGFTCYSVHSGLTFTITSNPLNFYTTIGSRLCFIPQQNKN